MHLTDLDHEWAKSYAMQALSDLDAREVLVRASVSKCHRLHFLQMAAEKMCKAHLTLKNGHARMKKTHEVIKKNLPIIARTFYARNSRNNKAAQRQITAIRQLAFQIEVLAPACDHGGNRPDNTEYPWQDGNGKIHTPCDHTFTNIDDGPGNRSIGPLVRLIRTAADSFRKQTDGSLGISSGERSGI